MHDPIHTASVRKLYDLHSRVMPVTGNLDRIALSWAYASSVSSLVRNRHRGPSPHDRLGSLYWSLATLFHGLMDFNLLRRSILSSPCWASSPPLRSSRPPSRNLFHYSWPCEAPSSAVLHVRRLFEELSAGAVHDQVAFTGVVKCEGPATLSAGAEFFHSPLFCGNPIAICRTKACGQFPPRLFEFFSVRASQVVRRCTTHSSAVKSIIPTWKWGPEEEQHQNRGRPLVLYDESGKYTLHMAPAAVHRLRSLCARRQFQRTSGSIVRNGDAISRGKQEKETTYKNKSQVLLGLQVRVTSGGCSGYQYSFALLTPEVVKQLRGKEEYRVFWPPDSLICPPTVASTSRHPRPNARMLPSASAVAALEAHAASSGLAEASHTSQGCEFDVASVEKQDRKIYGASYGSGITESTLDGWGWCVLVDECSLPLFGSNAVIGFEDSVAASEFVVQQNDRAENVCSCGRSFALRDEF